MLSAFGAFVVMMQLQSNLLDTQLEISKKEIAKLREQFSISPNYDSNNSNRLYVNVTNVGSIHAEIVDLLIINKSLTTRDATRYAISYNDAFVPLSSTIDILKNQPLYMADGTYDIKVVSALGTVKTSELTVVVGGGGDDPGTIEEIVLPAETFAKPAVFMSFPNPFGESEDSKDEGYFSMAVINPTNQTMNVTSVAFYAIGEEGGGGQFFSSSEPLEELSPTSGWGVTQKQVWWQDLDNPITIQKYNAYNFTVGVSSKTGQSLMQAVPITGTVYTNFGQFVTYGHSTGSSDITTVIANVYQSSSSTDTTRHYVISGVTESVSRTYYVSLENSATKAGDSSEILTNSVLVINVPPGFTNIASVASSPELDPQTFKIFNDGSTQIPVKLNTDMPKDTRWYYSFTATAPDVDNTTLYVFHILGHGKATDKNGDKLEFGPVAETIVQVCPTSGC